MATDPNSSELEPEMGSSKRMKEKTILLVVALPFAAIFFLSTINGFSDGVSFSIIAGAISVFVAWLLIRKLRVIKFKKNRGDYDPIIQAKKEAASQAMEKAATVAADTAEKTGTLTSGAIGLIKDAGGAVAEKLEQRATKDKDSNPEGNSSNKDDIAARLEKLSNLHEQGHISDEEFAQQRSRILDEV